MNTKPLIERIEALRNGPDAGDRAYDLAIDDVLQEIRTMEAASNATEDAGSAVTVNLEDLHRRVREAINDERHDCDEVRHIALNDAIGAIDRVFWKEIEKK